MSNKTPIKRPIKKETMIFLTFHGPLSMISLILGMPLNFAESYFSVAFSAFRLKIDEQQPFLVYACYYHIISFSLNNVPLKLYLRRKHTLSIPRDNIVQMIDRSFLACSRFPNS